MPLFFLIPFERLQITLITANDLNLIVYSHILIKNLKYLIILINDRINYGNNKSNKNRQEEGFRLMDSIVEYDNDDNTLYIKLTDQKIVSTIPLGDTVFIDISDNNKPVGIKCIVTDKNPETIKALQSLFLS